MKPWLLFFAAVLVTLALPSFVDQSFGKKPFDSSAIEDLKRVNPEFIFMGSSILETRFNPELFAKLTGKKAYFFQLGGSGLYHWYAQLTNLVIPSGVKPKHIFIFTDGHFPYHTIYTGQYRRAAESILKDEEPVYDLLTRKNRNRLTDRIADRLERIYPIQDYHDKAMNFVKRIAVMPLFPADLKFFLKRLTNPLSRKVFSEEEQRNYNARQEYLEDINSVFALKNLRSFNYGSAVSDDPLYYDLNAQLELSFLPYFLENARKAGLSLVFVRIKERPNDQGIVEQDEKEKKYLAELESYIRSQGSDYYDFTHDPEISLEMYSDGNHIDWEYRDFSTENFIKRMEKYL